MNGSGAVALEESPMVSSNLRSGLSIDRSFSGVCAIASKLALAFRNACSHSLVIPPFA